MAYEERLSLPWWWWLIGALLVGSVGAALLAYVPPWLGISFIAAFAIAVAAVLFGYGSTAITIDDDGLRVGRHRIESHWLAGAEAFDGADAQRVAGPEAEHRDFLITRPYISGLVRITLADPADPHPHWLISSRDPEGFATALNAATTPLTIEDHS